MLRIFQVVGKSMEPMIRPDDYLLTCSSKKIKINDIVVLTDSNYGNIVKRVNSISKNEVLLKSDNKNYSSPTCEYSHSVNNIIGKVFFKIRLIKFNQFFKNYLNF